MKGAASKSTRAWVLEWPAQPLALAPCEVIEIVDEPEVHRVPVGPDWCRALLYWRARFLPMALPAVGIVERPSVVVVAYQPAPCVPLEYAAIPVEGKPRQIDVPADADCEPPSNCVLAASYLRACFLWEGRAIVIPELRSLFAGESGKEMPAPTSAPGCTTGISLCSPGAPTGVAQQLTR
jgi:hypothetical protein